MRSNASPKVAQAPIARRTVRGNVITWHDGMGKAQRKHQARAGNVIYLPEAGEYPLPRPGEDGEPESTSPLFQAVALGVAAFLVALVVVLQFGAAIWRVL